MAIDVTVTESCDRCKRKEQVVISSDKVGEFEQKQLDAAQHQNDVQAFVNENKDKLPDLVVIFKGKVQILNGICDAHCAKTVQNNVDALFREHKPRARKSKASNGESTAAAPAKATKSKSKDKAATAPAS